MSQLNSVWVFSDNPERYAELFGGVSNGANRCMPLYKIPTSAGSYALWSKMYLCS